MADSWSKLPAESDEAYSRFLIYRNLGPCRSIRRAYFRYLQEYDGYRGGIKGINPPHNWRAECAEYFWVERSAAWDVRNLSAYGARIAVLHVQAMTKVAEKSVRYAKRLEPGDEGWGDLLDSIRLVAEFLTPDVIRAIQERSKPARAAADGRAGDRSRVE